MDAAAIPAKAEGHSPMSSEMRKLVEDWRSGRLSGYVGLTKTEQAVLRVCASELELRLARTEAGADDPILRGLARAVGEIDPDDGRWVSCSGCYETEDGHPVGDYPHSPILCCALGAGCSECGGLGAVWDTTDYAAFAEEQMADHPQDASGDAAPVLFGRGSGGDWYVDADTKSICVDVDFDPARQLSLILKQDGRVAWSIFVQEPDSSTTKATGPSVMNTGFYEALSYIAMQAKEAK
jgi:hypothetical protein